MSDFLATMAASSRERADRLTGPDVGLLDRPVPPLGLAGFDLIAEIKDHSPAEGRLAGTGANRAQRAQSYARGGAAAISVLTEPTRFAGGMEHLAEVVAAVGDTPVMRKDFLVDPAQVVEARAAGASGVLLIAAILDDAALEDMLACAQEHGLFVLLESFDAADLERSRALLDRQVHAGRAAAGELLIGINTRNLRTLEVDATRLERLAASLPPGAIAVAESGLRSPADAERVAGLGYAMALVGTALMKSEDPGALVADMLNAGRHGLAA